MADRKLVWLEVMRGFAAVWVLLHHATQSINHFVGPLGNSAMLIQNGYLGVDFFFILSGFIIAHASLRLDSHKDGGRIKEYFKARFIRIYTPYFTIGIGIYVLYFSFPGLSQADRTPSLLSTFLLLPSNDPPALSVAWTLVHEMIFYMVFSLWFVSRKIFWSVMVTWVIAVLLIWLSQPSLNLFASYFLSPLNLCFALGLGISLLTRRIAFSRLIAVALAVTGVLVVCAQGLNASPDRLWVAVGFGMLVLAAANPNITNDGVWRWSISLGTASYAIYLVHNPVLSIAVRAVKAGLPIGPWSGLVLISLVALGLGWLYWWVYERHALRLVRAWITPRNRQ